MFRNRERDKRLILILGVPALLWVGSALVLSTLTPFLVIASGGMSPHLHAGDLIVIRGISIEAVQPGDLIAFRSTTGGGATIYVDKVAGIVSVGDRSFIRTYSGDAVSDLRPDSDNGLLGKVVATVPFVGRLRLLSKETVTSVIAVILVFDLLYFLLPMVYRGRSSVPPGNGGDV